MRFSREKIIKSFQIGFLGSLENLHISKDEVLGKYLFEPLLNNLHRDVCEKLNINLAEDNFSDIDDE